jgi:small conductance mechanosensitive channel
MKEFVEHFLVAHLGTALPVWASSLISLTNVFLILAIAWGLLSFSGRLIRVLEKGWAARHPNPEERKRLETLTRVVRYITSVVVGAVAIMLVLAEIGISIAPILATAGVAGLAVGFGAQSLVKDYFTGFVMLLEDQIRVGDLVEAGGKSGTVEEVTLRYIRLRDLEGAVHFVPNGVIATVTNRSREFSFAMMDLRISYQSDLDQVYRAIREAAEVFARDPEYAARLLQPIEIMGVDQWHDSHQTVRCRFKVQPSEQQAVKRGFLKCLKQHFDAQGIRIPAKES